MKTLEFECFDCKEKVLIDCSDEEHLVVSANVFDYSEWPKRIQNEWIYSGWATSPYVMCPFCFMEGEEAQEARYQ